MRPRTVMTDRSIPLSTLDDCARYLRDQWRTPEQHVLDAFARRDVVLLAEDHAIRHNLLLVGRLVPLLPAAGVFTLGMEFGASEDQAALDALTTAEPVSYTHLTLPTSDLV